MEPSTAETMSPDPTADGAATTPAAAVVHFRVGDPDPTGRYSRCAVYDPTEDYWLCTWLNPHPGVPHVAGDGVKIRAVWW